MLSQYHRKRPNKKPASVEKRGRPLAANKSIHGEIRISAARKFLVSAAFGETGVGKSYQTELEIANYIQGFNGKQNGRRVLIVDTNGEYTKYPTVSLYHIPHIPDKKCYRLNLKGYDLEIKKQMAMQAVQKFNNGLLVLDDVDGYDPYSRDSKLIASLMGNRHKNLDLLLIHQSLDMGTPNFYRNGTALRLHKQVSNDQLIMDKAKECFPLLKIAQIIIDEQYHAGNIRFYLIVMLREKKIRGCSSLSEFMKAIVMYLNQYPGEIKAELSKIVTINPKLYASRNSIEVRTAAIEAIKARYLKYMS